MTPRVRRVLLTGGRGFIGSHILSRLSSREDLNVYHQDGNSRSQWSMDLETPGAIGRCVLDWKPDLVIHTAAVTSIAECESSPGKAMRVNVDVTQEIVSALHSNGGRLILFSTDQVFDGEASPYSTTDLPSPLHKYGETKALAEAEAGKMGSLSAILRPSLVLGHSPQGNRTPEETLLMAHAAGQPLGLFHDEIRSPVQVNDIADLTMALCDNWRGGILHVGGPQPLSRYELGRQLCEKLDLPTQDTITRSSRDVLAHADRRPRDLTLISDETWQYLDRAPSPP